MFKKLSKGYKCKSIWLTALVLVLTQHTVHMVTCLAACNPTQVYYTTMMQPCKPIDACVQHIFLCCNLSNKTENIRMYTECTKLFIINCSVLTCILLQLKLHYLPAVSTSATATQYWCLNMKSNTHVHSTPLTSLLHINLKDLIRLPFALVQHVSFSKTVRTPIKLCFVKM